MAIDVSTTAKRVDLYAGLMTELKVRLFSVEKLIEGNQDQHPQVLHEIFDLQVRMCCEIVALACAIAHFDLSVVRSKDFQKAYEPGVLMGKLESLHSDFFPRTVTPTRTQVGSIGHVHLEFAPSAISKSEVVALWNRAGGNLHRGTMRNILSGKRVLAATSPGTEAGLSRFKELVRMHAINLQGQSSFLVCEGLLDQPAAHVSCLIIKGRI